MINAIVAIPLIVSVIWALSCLLFGTGFILSYMAIHEMYGFSLLKTLIYGSIVNVSLAAILYGCTVLDEMDLIDLDKVLLYGLLEMLSIPIFMVALHL